jgi:hypothetical protein
MYRQRFNKPKLNQKELLNYKIQDPSALRTNTLPDSPPR